MSLLKKTKYVVLAVLCLQGINVTTAEKIDVDFNAYDLSETFDIMQNFPDHVGEIIETFNLHVATLPFSLRCEMIRNSLNLKSGPYASTYFDNRLVDFVSELGCAGNHLYYLAIYKDQQEEFVKELSKIKQFYQYIIDALDSKNIGIITDEDIKYQNRILYSFIEGQEWIDQCLSRSNLQDFEIENFGKIKTLLNNLQAYATLAFVK